MKYIEGNLIDLAFEGKFDVIIHGCNCFNTMRSGVAGEIARRIPNAYFADKYTQKGDRNKLGTWSGCYSLQGDFWVINAYTQYNYGYNEDVVYFDYEAFYKFLTTFRKSLDTEKVIAFPKIGAGLAKGDWNEISFMIDYNLSGYCKEIYIVTLPENK